MKKILFVHFHHLSDDSGGARRAFQNLQGCLRYGQCCTYQTDGRASGTDGRSSGGLGYAMFICSEECDDIVRILSNGGFGTVFFDTSLYGDAVGYIKQRCPDVKTVVHYHNFEKKYFEDEDKSHPGSAISEYAARCELSATQSSDFRVFISEKDRDDICMAYGLSVGQNIVIPVALPDYFQPTPRVEADSPYVLFIGSAFYANTEAVRYIMEKIAPNVAIKIKIAGKGMDCALGDTGDNVDIQGHVQSLGTLMAGAAAFISPIFSGSGSKIKIAEALMHGKYIIASAESLTGYNTSRMAVKLCKTGDDFIRAIDSIDPAITYYPENRELFLSEHEMGAVCRMYDFLETI